MFSNKKSLSFGRYVPNDEVLNKKVHENPKYKSIKPAIDTGKNVRKQIDELREKQKNCHHKKNEVFKRIKCITFLKLAVTFGMERLINEDNQAQHKCSPEEPKPNKSVRQKSVANVIMGIGELDLVADKKKVRCSLPKRSNPMPYLLLDVRDRDAFSQCHIITAKNYPSSMLSRSTGSETEDLMQFKHLPDSVIILYDEDEMIATRVATTLVEHGYENIFILTGGLKLALEICPENLTTSVQSALSPTHTFMQNQNLPPRATSNESFRKEDLESIERQILTYQSKAVPQPTFLSLHSMPSSRTNSNVRSQKLSASSWTSLQSCASSLSGRESACSSVHPEQRHPLSASSRVSRLSCTQPSIKNTERRVPKLITNGKSKLHKAPWK